MQQKPDDRETDGGSPDPKCRQAAAPSPEEISVPPVPLFLVPQAVAAEIRRHGRAVRVINVRRTRNHQYAVTVERGRP
ncbi:hypothetical protein [Methanoculleus oceani]|uniref:Uncharacterized protein n=1 Tax=Methanoculleus oceani TaxID=2184756 RepID=A0ABD4TDI7_9EURY|nr:hypothetical protein [Methanoculleus sp. CWC-02]MCM2465938.1 hypothetical protein [Methanoculleus sp. CWC-02]